VKPGLPISEKTLEIQRRLLAGERPADLAREYGLSKQRVHQMKTRLPEFVNPDGSLKKGQAASSRSGSKKTARRP
jgi:hypothetical protein